jgi:3'-5' exoribonuclease Rv2179c-like domain
MIMSEIYVSTDCETNGPLPGHNSMLSFASVAYTADGTMVAAYTANLALLPGSVPDPDTMAWWQKQSPEVWDAHRQNLVVPDSAMKSYVAWLKALPGKPVFVAYPAAYDFTYIYWYLMRFTKENPFSFRVIDIRTYAMALLGSTYADAAKNKLPTQWIPVDRPHTHVAIDDAIEQGDLFCNLLRVREDGKIEEIRRALGDGRL